MLSGMQMGHVVQTLSMVLIDFVVFVKDSPPG